MARSPRQRSVGTIAPAVTKYSAASGKPIVSETSPASVALMLSIPMSIPNPVNTTTAVAHTKRMARASVGKRARKRRQLPNGNGASHQKELPTAALIDWPVKDMTAGLRLITKSAHPACPIAKLTRSRRPAADARAARNTPLTAAELAAPEGVLIAAAVADSEGEVAAPRPPALDSASAPRRSQRQPARPRSSRRRISQFATLGTAGCSHWLPPVPPDRRQTRPRRCHGSTGKGKRLERLSTRCGRTSDQTTARIVIRLALGPIGKAGSITRHAAVPTLGRAEPRLVLAIPCSELYHHEGILRRRADAGRRAAVLLAQVHAAEQRGGALGRHEEAGGAGRRGSPAGWARSRDEREEEEGGDRQHASRDYEIVRVAHADATRECKQRLACAHRHGNRAIPRRRQHCHSRIIVAKPLERLDAGRNDGLRGLHLLVDEGWHRGVGSEVRPGRRHGDEGRARLPYAKLAVA
eukprot:scaffold16490_cov73-Phaeocystis_antarctica.AAC.3